MDLDDIVFGGLLGGLLFSGSNDPSPRPSRINPNPPTPPTPKPKPYPFGSKANPNSFLGGTYNPRRKYTGQVGKVSIKSLFVEKTKPKPRGSRKRCPR